MLATISPAVGLVAMPSSDAQFLALALARFFETTVEAMFDARALILLGGRG